jgi:hypothetical protein
MEDDVRQTEEANQRKVQELMQKFERHPDVLEFVKRSIEGVWCKYFRERTNEWLPALYSLVDGAAYFILLIGENLDVTEVVCPVVSVEAVGSLKTDVPGVFPEKMMEMLASSEADRLVMVTYDKAGQLTRFCILEESELTPSNFVRGMVATSAYTKHRERKARENRDVHREQAYFDDLFAELTEAQEAFEVENRDKPKATEDSNVLSSDSDGEGAQIPAPLIPDELLEFEDDELISNAPPDPAVVRAHVVDKQLEADGKTVVLL